MSDSASVVKWISCDPPKVASQVRFLSEVPLNFYIPDMQAPADIVYHTQTKVLEIVEQTGEVYSLTAEFLRVMSPSAEVQGHTPDEARLQVGKREVSIVGIEPVGFYAIRIVFSDGHDSGYYDWEYLRKIAQDHDELWAEYLAKLESAGATREADDPRNELFKVKPRKACHR